MNTRPGRRWCAAIALGGAALAAPAEARADSDGEIFATIIGLTFVGDIVFSVYDIAVVSRNEPPDYGWAVAQAVFATPQAVILDTAVVVAAASDPDHEWLIPALLFVPVAWSNQLATYGIWSSVSEAPSVTGVYALSWAFGADIPLYAYALTMGANGKLPGSGMGVLEMIVATPQIAYGSVALAGADEPGALWGSLVGISGALFLHGAVSLIVSVATDDAVPEEDPKPTRVETRPEAPSRPEPTGAPPAESPVQQVPRGGTSWIVAPMAMPGWPGGPPIGGPGLQAIHVF